VAQGIWYRRYRGIGGTFIDLSRRRPTLNQEQCELVRVTFAKIALNPDMAAAMFYARVFSTNPALRGLFKIDMIEQGKKLMDTLTVFIDNLHQFEQIRTAVRDLGRRHFGYGVKYADYDTLETALLWTIEKVLGADFTPAVGDAWTECYRTLAVEMKSAGPTG
jgi:hemoglobin-like flavoprotein